MFRREMGMITWGFGGSRTGNLSSSSFSLLYLKAYVYPFFSSSILEYCTTSYSRVTK
jgi:hypothetical protein